MTQEEILELAKAIAEDRIAPDDVDWTEISTDQFNQLLWMVDYVAADNRLKEFEARSRPAQRRAYRLLRTLLTPEQRQQLTQGRNFRVTGSAGRTYRLWPAVHLVEKVEKHGRYWFRKGSFCLHPEPETVPKADVTIGHLLMLRADEPGFLQLANFTGASMLWDGDWMRRLNRARLMCADEQEFERLREGALEWAEHDPFLDGEEIAPVIDHDEEAACIA